MDVINVNNLENAQNILNDLTNTNVNVKVIKKDKGLMEKNECTEKVILTEDNRQVIFG